MNPTKFRALLVEEDAELAAAMMSALTISRFEPRHVAETRAGTETFRQWQPHLVLLSLGLPRIGGVALCAPLRALSSVPIVILSIRTRREDHLHALNLGADEFITMRPFDEQITVGRILTLMRRVYHYNQSVLPASLDTAPLQQPQSELPAGWVTCDSCGYMGPANRFNRLNAQGHPAVLCPHCDRSQSLVYSVA